MNNRVIGTVASKNKDKQPRCTRNANKASGSLKVLTSEAFIEQKKAAPTAASPVSPEGRKDALTSQRY
jgi:hypothetical protein